MSFKGRRSQKQQRELDAKMHQTLRSLMFPHYEREESARRSALLEAQRIVAGTHNQPAVIKEEQVVAEDEDLDLDLECDLELEPRVEPMEAQPLPPPPPPPPPPLQPEPPNVKRKEPRAKPRRAATPLSSVEDRPARQDHAEPEPNGELLDGGDGYTNEYLDEDESLFENELTAEQKLQLSGDAPAFENRVTDHYPEITLDVDTEVTLEGLKTLSLEDVCVRMAYCAHAAASGGDSKHSGSWYLGMMKTCLEAVATHDYARPHVPFEVERLLDQYCDSLNEAFQAEEERNLRKLERRNIGFAANFECVYPASTEKMVSSKLLLTGVAGDTNAFFRLYFEGVHMKDDKSCYDDCICLSVSPRDPNVLHFAAAHGNAQFIKKVLFPDKALPDDPVVRDHYRNMMFAWACSAIDTISNQMYPFDVAVFYDYKDCAREFLGYETCAKMLRERKTEMTRARSSLPFREYIESPLSIAVYHGNMEMIRMLLYWQLIKPQHFPQAFREAANAGDIAMLGELWEMCGRDLNLVTEQNAESQGICTPLHVAAAAGQLRAVQFLCYLGEGLRTKPDAAGDLPLTYAIENGHMAVVDFLMKTFRTEVRHTVIRSAIACKRNRLAKQIFHDMLDLREVIDEVRPLKFAVDVENFHCAEYFLKQYMNEKKVTEWPWANDISEALEAVLRCRTLTPEQKTKFVVAFQLAGVKISMVNILKIVTDRPVAALICNSLRSSSNQPKPS
ncbi:hypothetical protein Y032_0402g809 [Ancylostoma ceylanicum]|uniref:Uncharacterized protein n=1 Tax=Ancylostoma ceylanicum TaxID=53326 RepID=A0A016X413_9BILA|nr:hypothetical protein Y032_0402g809 [Ancylostoma ceylanicum]